MHFKGLGVAKDSAEARRWWRLAAAKGHAGAQLNLGLMYYVGISVVQDYAEAAKWYRLAAEQGNEVAQSNLARMYADGEGVAKRCPLADRFGSAWRRLG